MTDKERERILQKIEDIREELFEYTLAQDNRVISNAFDELSDYVRNMWTYEESRDFLSALNYCRQGQNPLMAAALDDNGIGGLVFQRDELGRLTQIDYIYGFPFDSDSLFALKYKVSQNPGLKEKHAGDVQHVSLSYDADNNLRELRFLDADGGLMALGLAGIDSPADANAFCRKIRENHGGLMNCRDLLRRNMEDGPLCRGNHSGAS